MADDAPKSMRCLHYGEHIIFTAASGPGVVDLHPCGREVPADLESPERRLEGIVMNPVVDVILDTMINVAGFIFWLISLPMAV